jgi:hypothetical protein
VWDAELRKKHSPAKQAAVMLVLELAGNSELFDYVAPPLEPLPEALACAYFGQLVSGATVPAVIWWIVSPPNDVSTACWCVGVGVLQRCTIATPRACTTVTSNRKTCCLEMRSR